MAKQPQDQIDEKTPRIYPVPGPDNENLKTQRRFQSDPLDALLDEPGQPIDLEFVRSQLDLKWQPDPTLTGMAFSNVEYAAPAAALAVLVRCLERVLPLVAWHRELDHLTRAAFQSGVAACLRGPRPVGSSAVSDKAHLLAALVRLLWASSVDPALREGAGQAAWVALYLLEALDNPAVWTDWLRCQAAARAASAAVEAASGEPVRHRDCERLTAALRRDLDTLPTLDPFANGGHVDPGEEGPFGRLWVDEPPRVIQVACTPPQVLAAELTRLSESPKLIPVPSPVATKKTEENAPPDPLSALSGPDHALSPEEAVGALVRLLAAVRTEHAPHIDEFRLILKALAGHDFKDKARTATVVQQLQAARTLLGLGFVLLHEDAEKNRARVSLMFDSDPSYPEGRVRAVSSATPQKKLYARTALPALDVTDISPET